jgi:serine protease Do
MPLVRRPCHTAVVLVFVLALSLASIGAQEGNRRVPPGPDSAWMGVVLGTPTGPAIEGSGLSEGVAVRYVIDGGPAAEAGMRARDVIKSLNGRPVSTNQELLDALGTEAPGNWIPVTVARHEDERDFRIKLSERPENVRGLKTIRGWIGLELIELPPALREHFGAPAEAGAMVAGIAAGSPSEIAGFALGDVIYEIEGIPIDVGKRFYREVSGLGVGNEAEFAVMRDGVEVVLEAVVEKHPDNRRDESAAP